MLEKYFLQDDATLQDGAWRLPFAAFSTPATLRGDVHDFVATHSSDLGKSGAVLSGRAIARILHRIPSPSFPRKDWDKNRFWGMHRDVDFDTLRRLADEQLETVRRMNLVKGQAAKRAKSRQDDRKKRAESVRFLSDDA